MITVYFQSGGSALQSMEVNPAFQFSNFKVDISLLAHIVCPGLGELPSIFFLKHDEMDMKIFKVISMDEQYSDIPGIETVQVVTMAHLRESYPTAGTIDMPFLVADRIRLR